jgi:natural product biosynthesis luciferase-like monooxygenase protein
MQFGVMFFSSTDDAASPDKYGLLKSAAQFADRHGFSAIWTPERHFHPFGGLYPNPALTSCALAMITERISLRAGSVISPLHDAIRIAEEWSVVDNLSGGRVAISFGSGWNAKDFIFFPERYQHRQAFMYEQIHTIERLWQGESIARTDSFGNQVEVRLHPRPVQQKLPIWVTSSGSPATFARAGAIGANVLTHLLGQDLPTLAERIAIYRDAREAHGFCAESGMVSLMLHTFIGNDLEEVYWKVRAPLRNYLRSAISLEQVGASTGGTVSGGKTLTSTRLDSSDEDELLDIAYDRYFNTSSLLGTPDTCGEMANRLRDIGVDEIACLIDFGVDAGETLESLERMSELIRRLHWTTSHAA